MGERSLLHSLPKKETDMLTIYGTLGQGKSSVYFLTHIHYIYSHIWNAFDGLLPERGRPTAKGPDVNLLTV